MADDDDILDLSEDFDFDSFDQPDDRSPVQKLKDGALLELRSKDTIINSARRASYSALPPGIQSATDDVQDLTDRGKRIYDKQLREIKPQLGVLRKAGRKALPVTKKILPAKVNQRLEEMTKDPAVRVVRDEVDPVEAAIEKGLSDIFEAEVSLQASMDAKRDAEQKIRDELTQEENRLTFETNSLIADGVSKLVRYQNTVLNRYQRKSLELQYRSYFALSDLLLATKAGTADTLTVLKAITKNTSLPNEQKVQLGETGVAANERVADIKRNLINRAEQFGRDAVGGIRSGLDAADQALGDGDSPGGGLGVDSTELAGGVVAGGIAGGAAGIAGNRLGQAIMRSRRARELNERFELFQENLTRRAASASEGEGRFAKLLRRLISTRQLDDERIENSLAQNAGQPVPFDRLTRRSVTEVIPGYLSRILKEVTEINTGQPASAINYDTSLERFVTSREAAIALGNRLEVEQGGDGLKFNGDRLLKIFDPENVLPDQARKDFLQQAIQDSAKGMAFDPVRYADATNINSEFAETISAAIRDGFNVQEEDGKLKAAGDEGTLLDIRKASRSFNRLGKERSNFNRIIRQMDAQGGGDILRELGVLVSDEGGIDRISTEFKEELVRQRLDGKSIQEALADLIEQNRTFRPSADPDIETASTIDDTIDSVMAQGRKIKEGFDQRKAQVNNQFTKAKDRVEDLYTETQSAAPRIRKAGIEAGEYIDVRTQRVIERTEDITGEVRDRLGNVVLTAKEYSQGLINRRGNILTKGLKGVGSLYKLQFKALKAITTAPLKLIGLARQRKEDMDLYFGDEVAPRLRASVLQIGGYFNEDGTVIQSFKDMKGAILDRQGNVVVSARESTIGLRTKAGTLVKAGLLQSSKIKANLKRTFTSGDSMDSERESLSKTMMALKERLDQAELNDRPDIAKKLDEMIQVLSPKQKRGDLDGDGDRDGSFRDQRSAKKGDQVTIEESLGKTRQERRRQSITGSLGTLAGTIGSGRRRSTDGDDGDEGSGLSDALEIGAGVAGGAAVSKGAEAAASGAKGFFQKVGRTLKGGAGKVLGKRAAVATAARAATVAAGGLATGGALSSIGGGVAATAGALFSAPVLIGIAAAGALAFGGYHAYKALERRSDLEPLEKLRFLQYGVPVDNLKAIVSIRWLEEKLQKKIKIDERFQIEFEDTFEEIWRAYADDFSADKNNAIHKERFYIWFYQRFMQVYAIHRIAAMFFKARFLKLDKDIPPLEKADFVSRVQFGQEQIEQGIDPYGISESPWPAITLEDNKAQISDLTVAIIEASEVGENLTLDNSKETEKLVRLNRGNNRSRSRTKYQPLGSSLELSSKKRRRQQAAPNVLSAQRSSEDRFSAIKNQIDPNIVTRSRKEDIGLLSVPAVGRISSPFGMRVHPIEGTHKHHNGIDIAAPTGTKVYAASSGLVDRADFSNSYGNVIYLQHPDGRSTRYAHLSRMFVTEGQEVKEGDVIGLVGNTGRSTGPHLHFEYRDNDQSTSVRSNQNSILNPVAYFHKGSKKDDAIDQVRMDMRAQANLVRPTRSPSTLQATANYDTLGQSERRRRRSSSQTEREITAPTVNVDAPDLDGLNTTSREIAGEAFGQRNTQVEELRRNNALLEKISMQLAENASDTQPLPQQDLNRLNTSIRGQNRIRPTVDPTV